MAASKVSRPDADVARDGRNRAKVGREIITHSVSCGGGETMSAKTVKQTEREYLCEACHRTFVAFPEDVEAACGHLCIAMDRGLTQRQGLEELREAVNR